MNNSIDSKLIQDKAISLFENGYNCSQSILSAYSEILNLDNGIAISISCGFGAGMGRLQGTCGAVTGAYMVLGMIVSNRFDDNNHRKEKSYQMIQDFNRKFVELHKSTDCKTLLNCDLNTAEGQQKFKSNNLFESVCKTCIKDSILLTNELTTNY